MPTGPHNLVVVAETRVRAGSTRPPRSTAGRALTELLRHDAGISSVVSYWATGNAALRSADGRTALVLARITGTEDERKTTLVRLFPRIHGQHGALSLRLGGQPAVEREVTDRSEKDLRRMELLATPVVAVVLLFVFGSVVASLLPLVIGLTAIVGTLVTLRLLTMVTDVSMYSLNIATALSLGLAIDYGLFIVTRYREELDAGAPVPAAVATTLTTAGRTVLFSALTVALSLSSLLVFPLYYLRSFAYAGIAVVGFAALSAVVVLPAVLLVLGRQRRPLGRGAGVREPARPQPRSAQRTAPRRLGPVRRSAEPLRDGALAPARHLRDAPSRPPGHRGRHRASRPRLTVSRGALCAARRVEPAAEQREPPRRASC